MLYCGNGSVYIHVSGSPDLQLSKRQVLILYALQERGPLSTKQLRRAAFSEAKGSASQETESSGLGASASERASMSRTLRRLEDQGLVNRSNKQISISDFGVRVVDHLTGNNLNLMMMDPDRMALESLDMESKLRQFEASPDRS